jgi:hypothetical protein
MNPEQTFFCKLNNAQLEKQECLRRQESRMTYEPCRTGPSYLECRGCEQGRAIMDSTQEVTVTEEKTTKQCSKCKEFKPMDDFGVNKQTKDGRSWYCKKCNAKRTRENWKKKHGENIQASDSRLKEIAREVKKRAEPKETANNGHLSIIPQLELLKKDLLRKVSAIDTAIEALK